MAKKGECCRDCNFSDPLRVLGAMHHQRKQVLVTCALGNGPDEFCFGEESRKISHLAASGVHSNPLIEVTPSPLPRNSSVGD